MALFPDENDAQQGQRPSAQAREYRQMLRNLARSRMETRRALRAVFSGQMAPDPQLFRLLDVQTEAVRNVLARLKALEPERYFSSAYKIVRITHAQDGHDETNL